MKSVETHPRPSDSRTSVVRRTLLGFGNADDRVLVDQGLRGTTGDDDSVAVESLDGAANGFAGDQSEGQSLPFLQSPEKEAVLDVDRGGPWPFRPFVGPTETIIRVDEVNADDFAPNLVGVTLQRGESLVGQARKTEPRRGSAIIEQLGKIRNLSASTVENPFRSYQITELDNTRVPQRSRSRR